jgi:HEPN domain-containing protein
VSGERVELLKLRARKFLELSIELLGRGSLDLAAFNMQQACQLRIKASLLKLLGEVPKIHSVRELLGILMMKLSELGFEVISNVVKDFSRRYRDVLADIDSVCTMSRYSEFTYSVNDVKEMISVCSELHKLLDEVEKSVLG